MTEAAIVPADTEIVAVEASESEIANYLRPQEARAIIEAATTPRDHLLMNILWQAAPRASEVVGTRRNEPRMPGIRPMDITDAGIQFVTLKQRKSTKKRNPSGSWVSRKEPVVKKQIVRRTIPIQPELRAEIMEYCFKAQIKTDEPIFPISIVRVEQIVKRLAAKANVTYKRVHPHSFRHGFAVNFINQSGDIAKLQTILGHSNLQTTAIYLKFTNRDIRKEIERMVF